MADYPEKDVVKEEEMAENSTIFSDPTAHKNVEIKKKKVWPKILAGLLCLCLVIGSAVAVVKLIPVPDEENENLFAQEISIKKFNLNDISSVTVTNKNCTAQFYSKVVDESTQWYIKSISSDLTDSTVISDVITALSTINASRKITEKTAEDCGLKNPSIKAEVNPKKGEKYTVLLGDASPDNSGYYFTVKDSDEIYTVSTDMWNTLNFELLNFASTNMLSGFTNDDSELDDYYQNGILSYFDNLVIAGKNYPETIEIKRNQDEEMAQYLGYLITKPIQRIADNTDEVFSLFQNGMEVIGAYSYDVKVESLKKFGLINPDLQLTMSVGKKTITYKFALQDDGNYAAVSNSSKLIHQISADTLQSVTGLSTTDYYSPWICYHSINDLSSFTVKTETKDYKFGIVKNEVSEEDQDEDGAEQEDYTITYNGKKLTALNFQHLYQYCISLKCNDFVIENTNKKPSVSFVFGFKNGKESVIEFIQVSATRYQYRVDGIDMGRVSATSINKVIDNVKTVAAGKTVGQLI